MWGLLTRFTPLKNHFTAYSALFRRIESHSSSDLSILECRKSEEETKSKRRGHY